MVDTTTQTPRDDYVTENNDSKNGDEDQDTTAYTEEHKEDIEGGESTKDSGIHQDEDGYDESYADEDFEDDEVHSDDENEGIHAKISQLFNMGINKRYPESRGFLLGTPVSWITQPKVGLGTSCSTDPHQLAYVVVVTLPL